MKNSRSLFVVVLAALMSACGGGDGGSTPPPPPPPVIIPPSATVEITSYTPTNGAANVVTSVAPAVTFKVTNGTYASSSVGLACNGNTVAGAAAVAGNILTFSPTSPLPHSVTCALTGTITGTGTGGSGLTSVNTSFTTVAPPILRYDQVTVGVYSGNPAIITDTVTTTGPVLATNLSLATLGPVGKCLIGEEPLADGMFPELCAANDGKFHQMLHDVVANTIIEYKGTLPLGYEFMLQQDGSLTVGPKWHACMRFCGTGDWGAPPEPYMNVWAKAKGGGYIFTANPDGRILQKIDSAGNITKLWQDLNGYDFVVMTTISHVFHYSELKLTVFADRGAYIGTVSPSGATPLSNNTGWTNDPTKPFDPSNPAFPVAVCAIWDKLLPNGQPLVSCQTPGTKGGNLRRNFPIDPDKKSMEAEYLGMVPDGAVLRDVGYGTFGDTPYAAFGVGNKGMYLDATEGTYYILNDDMVNLRLTSDRFLTNKVVASCPGIQCFKYLVVLSNYESLRYSEKVYAIWGIFAKPYLLNKDGTKTVVENASSYTTGGAGINPLAGCAKGVKLADGRRLLRCQNTANGTEVNLYLDPSTNKMHDYREALPPGATWTYVQTDGAHYPIWARETVASDGTYFVDGTITWKVMFQDLTGRVSIAVDGTFASDGDVSVLWTEQAQ